jgi:hypothetical protein
MKKFTISLCISAFALFGMANAQETSYLEFVPQDGSYVDCGHSPDFSPAEFTFEAWVRVNDWTGGDYIAANEGDNEGEQGFALRFTGDQLLELSLGTQSDGWQGLASADAFTPGEWYHVAVTYAATTVEFYVNGVLNNSGNVPSAMVASDQALFLGDGSMWQGRRLHGDMYDVRMWSDVRTETEIADNMNSYLSGEEENLVANWKMDEGAGTTLADASPNGYIADLGTSVAWGVITSSNEISADNDGNIQFYPNPASEKVVVSNKGNGEASVRLVDASGKVCKSFTLPGNSVQNIAISDVENGLYFVISEDASGESVSKLLVY